ncbi:MULTISPECIES: hypothetical protein [unclassified Agromyces]|uniref:hypothetical protein n=1 Tax=unclassified Agromyces TaxID=2639701 RepID=UPI00301427A9
MPDDERIARLRRLAYGAAVPRADRTAAEAELAALRGPATGAVPADGEDTAVGAPGQADAARDAGPIDARGVGRSRAASGLAAAAAGALLAGVGLGWAAAGLASPGAGAGAGAPSSAGAVAPTSSVPAIPFEDAAAMAVFDREQVAADRTPITDGRIWVDRATQRRLLTLPDGATVTAVRTVNGADVCLLIEHPRRGGGSTCLQDPRFPAAGITLDVALDGVGYELAWMPSGEIAVRRAPAR